MGVVAKERHFGKNRKQKPGRVIVAPAMVREVIVRSLVMIVDCGIWAVAKEHHFVKTGMKTRAVMLPSALSLMLLRVKVRSLVMTIDCGMWVVGKERQFGKTGMKTRGVIVPSAMVRGMMVMVRSLVRTVDLDIPRF
jgi:hypothetical protein